MQEKNYDISFPLTDSSSIVFVAGIYPNRLACIPTNVKFLRFRDTYKNTRIHIEHQNIYSMVIEIVKNSE